MGDGQTTGGSNSILSLSGMEARIAKVDSVLAGFLPTLEADAAPIVADVGSILTGVKGVVGAGSVVAGVAAGVSALGPVGAAVLGLLSLVEGLIAATQPGSSVPASVGILTGGEAVGPNAAPSSSK